MRGILVLFAKFSKKHPGISAISNMISLLLVVVLLIFAAYKFGVHNAPPTTVYVPSDSGLSLPGEKIKRVVTENEIDMQLAEIKELATYSGTYHVIHSEDFSRLIGNSVIPGTTNVISFECDGVIKVGYDLDNISYKIGEDEIELKLPKPEILDNYVIWDTVICNEKNNILHPINFDEYKVVLEAIEQEGVKEAENKKIYDLAEKNMKLLIKNALSVFSDYSVKFVD